jgi:hypothetical protein
MLIFRAIALLLIAAIVVSLAALLATRDRRWLQRAILLGRWFVVLCLGFAAVLLLERLVLLL